MENRISCFARMLANTPDILTMFQGVVFTALQVLNSFCCYIESMWCLLASAPLKNGEIKAQED